VTETYDKINHWYGWNGGERPVHAYTIVDTVDVDGGSWRGAASGANWSHDNRPHDIAAFRITRLYVEPKVPREWWVNVKSCGSIVMSAPNDGWLGEVVCVREVLEPGQ
jgi:hypothetical protein